MSGEDCWIGWVWIDDEKERLECFDLQWGFSFHPGCDFGYQSAVENVARTELVRMTQKMVVESVLKHHALHCTASPLSSYTVYHSPPLFAHAVDSSSLAG